MTLTEIEMLGLEIKRELSSVSHELHLKKNALKLSKEQLSKAVTEVQTIKNELSKSQRNYEELKSSWIIRCEAVKRLEDENSQMRDLLARIRVQSDLYSTEREQLIQRCQTAETEMNKLNGKLEEYEKKENREVALRDECSQMQQKLHNILNTTVGQMGELKKDHNRIDKAHVDINDLIKRTKQNSELQNKKIQLNEELYQSLEKKLLEVSEELDLTKGELNELKESKSNVNTIKQDYFDEWKNYQKHMGERLRSLQEYNVRLVEELSLVKTSEDV